VIVTDINVLNNFLFEGVNDKGVLKAVFMAGGPGSGKSFAADKIFGVDTIMSGTSTLGLKVINSDIQFERLLKKVHIDPTKLGQMTDKLFQYYTTRPESPRIKAKETVTKLKKIYELGRLGMVLDGTGKDYNKIANEQSRLESIGYDTAMVFVNTDLKTALQRNRQRERVIKDDLVAAYWKKTQANIGKFQTLFGKYMYIVDNTEIGDFNKIHKRKISLTTKFVNKPIDNNIGRQWIENELKLKSLNIK